MRLDAYVAEQLSSSRAHAKLLIENGHVSDDSVVVRKPSHIVKDAQSISVDVPERAKHHIDLPAVYEDDDIKVVIKPAGMLVHPTSAHQEEPTVVDTIREQTTDDDVVRPGIVHRLDRNTSGLMILAKSKEAKEFMQKQFASHNVQKTYIALVIGHLDEQTANIKVPLGRSKTHPLKRVATQAGKPAETIYTVLESLGDYDLIQAKPKTGRTHQLRAHFAHIGHPIVGDKLYGADSNLGLTRYFLHAAKLEFTAPNGKQVTVEAPLPNELQQILTRLGRTV